MSNSIVRLAFDGSVAWTAPPVSVPDEPGVDRCRGPGRGAGGARRRSVSSHSIFVAEKYGSSTSPVRCRTSGSVAGGGELRRSAPRCAGPARRWRGADGRPVRAVPRHDRLALVGDADARPTVDRRRARRRRRRAWPRRRARSRPGRAPPSPGAGSAGGTPGRTPCRTVAGGIDGPAADAGGAGVDGDDVGHRRAARRRPSARGRWRRRLVAFVRLVAGRLRPAAGRRGGWPRPSPPRRCAIAAARRSAELRRRRRRRSSA